MHSGLTARGGGTWSCCGSNKECRSPCRGPCRRNSTLAAQRPRSFAGTPAGTREYIAEQAEEGGVNYVVCDLAFGDITLDEAMRSVELFAKEVMPAFAEA